MGKKQIVPDVLRSKTYNDLALDQVGQDIKGTEENPIQGSTYNDLEASSQTGEVRPGSTIGGVQGWKVYKDVIQSDASEPASGVYIDALNELIRVGASTGNYITVDGANLRIRSSTYSAGVAGFSIEPGTSEFNDVTVRGTIYATAGDIGGWNIVSGYIYSLQSGTPTSSPVDGLVMASGNEGIICYEDGAKRLEMGYISAGVYGMKVYATDGTTVIWETSDTQQIIAGWYFTDTTMASALVTNDASVLIDSANALIRLGKTSQTTISVDGLNQRIQSSNYVSGFAGAGFHLSGALLETGNIAARGILRSTTFEINNIAVHSGSDLIIKGGDVLAADMTAAD